MAGYIGSGASVVSSGAERKKVFDITTNTTSLTGLNYTVGKVHVYHNGVRLVDGTDYTATNSTSITLTVAAVSGDQVVVVSYASYQVALSGIDDQSNAVALTIDSSEKVLIGKTSAGYNVDGFEAHQNGETYVSRSGTPMAINRNSSDGTLLNFYKDGGGVGSIQSRAGAMLSIAFNPSGSDGAGFTGGSNAVLPTNATALSDNAIDLGVGSYRYKDLYLSGDIAHKDAAGNARLLYDKSENLLGNAGTNLYGAGIYLGGTGSANKLDDYEEGTWTITLQNVASNDIKLWNISPQCIYQNWTSWYILMAICHGIIAHLIPMQ